MLRTLKDKNIFIQSTKTEQTLKGEDEGFFFFFFFHLAKQRRFGSGKENTYLLHFFFLGETKPFLKSEMENLNLFFLKKKKKIKYGHLIVMIIR